MAEEIATVQGLTLGTSACGLPKATFQAMLGILARHGSPRQDNLTHRSRWQSFLTSSALAI